MSKEALTWQLENNSEVDFSSQKFNSRDLHGVMGRISIVEIAKVPKRFGKAIKHSCNRKPLEI